MIIFLSKRKRQTFITNTSCSHSFVLKLTNSVRLNYKCHLAFIHGVVVTVGKEKSSDKQLSQR